MNPDPSKPDNVESSEAVVSRIRAKRSDLQASLTEAEQAPIRWPILILFMGFFGCFFGLFGMPIYGGVFEIIVAICTTSFGLFVGYMAYLGLRWAVRSKLRDEIKAQDQILGGVDLDNLQETLEEDFFTKLVKINFRYIDQYYLQTQSQADKSFVLCATVAVIGLLILIAGIALMFSGLTTPAYVTVASGVTGEFIASVFFYLYNRTILKMGQYHHKLVITQNVSIALKIAEGLPDAERILAQQELVKRLTEDVNRLLTSPGESE